MAVADTSVIIHGRNILLLKGIVYIRRMPVQLDIIRETEVNISSAMTDQSDSLATERKNHKRSSDLLAKVQKKLAAQPGTLCCLPMDARRTCTMRTGRCFQSTFSPCISPV